MRTFKLFTLLIIAVLIFGSAAFFGYELFIKPSRAEKREKVIAASAPAPTPTPDPGIPDFQRLKNLQGSGKLSEAHDGWELWIAHNPQSPLLKEARQQLGAANTTLLFQPGSTNVVTYTVVKGDSLARIASKHQSNAELIQKANDLPNINLSIGQQLVIPSLKISLELDRSAKTLTVLNDGIFLKEFPLLSSPSAPKKPVTLNSKVLDKVASAGAKRVAFGDKAYPMSERTILLVQSPGIVAAPVPETSTPATVTPDKVTTNQVTNSPSAASPATPSTAPTPVPMPPGYVLSSADLLELFPLVSRNTPAIIH